MNRARSSETYYIISEIYGAEHKGETFPVYLAVCALEQSEGICRIRRNH